MDNNDQSTWMSITLGTQCPLACKYTWIREVEMALLNIYTNLLSTPPFITVESWIPIWIEVFFIKIYICHI